MEKTCTKCGETKPIDRFEVVWNGTKNVMRNKCKECIKLQRKIYYQENRKEIRRKRNEAYKNSEEVREKVRIQSEEWVKKNPDKRKAIALNYYYRHKGKVLKAQSKYRDENKKEIRSRWQKRIDSLDDLYVKSILIKHINGLKSGDIPQWLIDVKREEIKLHRKLLELKIIADGQSE